MCVDGRLAEAMRRRRESTAGGPVRIQGPRAPGRTGRGRGPAGGADRPGRGPAGGADRPGARTLVARVILFAAVFVSLAGPSVPALAQTEDPAPFSVNVSARELAEGESVTLTVALPVAATGTATEIPLSVSRWNSAQLGGDPDYSLTPDEVSIPVGLTSVTLQFMALVDSEDDEDPEQFRLDFGPYMNTRVAEIFTIWDDVVPVRVSVSSTRSPIEAGEAASFRISRQYGDPMVPLPVRFRFDAGGLTRGAGPTCCEVTIPANEGFVDLDFPLYWPTGDGPGERTATLVIEPSTAGSPYVIDTATASVTVGSPAYVVSIMAVTSEITEGETARFRLTRTVPEGGITGVPEPRDTKVTVLISGDFQNPRAAFVTFGPSLTEKMFSYRTWHDPSEGTSRELTVTIHPGDRHLVDSNAARAVVALRDKPPPLVVESVTVMPDPVPEDGGNTTVTVVLDRQVAENDDAVFPVTYGGTATRGADFTGPDQVEFGPGSAQALGGSTATFDLAIIDDRVDDDNETITVTIGGEQGTVAITDNDNAPVVESVTAMPDPVPEDGGNTTVTVVLDRQLAENDDAVFPVTYGGTATRGADFTGPDQVEFGPGSAQALGGSTATFDLAIIDDRVDDDNETITVTIGGEQGTVAITDNDNAPVIPGSRDSFVAHAGSMAAFATLEATDADNDRLIWRISAGADRSHFSLTQGGSLSFTQAKDFANPDDANRDGVYELTVEATDGANSVTVDLRITLAELTLRLSESRVREGAGDVILSVESSSPVSAELTVRIAEAPGVVHSASATSDWAFDGEPSIRIPSGETTGRLTIAIVEDDVVERDETVTFIALVDNVPIGSPQSLTIADDDREPASDLRSLRDRVAGEWLPRFGAMVTGLVTETIGDRLARGGRGGTRLVVGGHEVGPVPANENASAGSSPRGAGDPSARDGVAFEVSLVEGRGFAGGPDGLRARDRSVRSVGEFLSGSAFALQGRVGATPESAWAVWGEGAGAGFDDAVDGLSLDGRGIFGGAGLEYASKDWRGGLALFHSRGEGSYGLARGGVSISDDVEAHLTSLHPYLRWSPDEVTMLWGMAGYGWGAMTVSDPTGDHESGISLAMGSLGGNRRVYSKDGFELSVVSGGFWSHVRSDGTTDLSEVRGDVHRVRLGLELGQEHPMAGGASLRPSAEIGVRHDGGDARSGLGVEVGGALRYANPSRGLTAEVGSRVLALHSDDEHREWGVSGLVRIGPGADGRGLRLALEPSFGASAGGGLEQDPTFVLARPAAAEGRLELSLAYRLSALRKEWVLTPRARVTLSGARAPLYGAGLDLRHGSSFSLGLESTHRFAGDDEHGFRLRASLRR